MSSLSSTSENILGGISSSSNIISNIDNYTTFRLYKHLYTEAGKSSNWVILLPSKKLLTLVNLAMIKLFLPRIFPPTLSYSTSFRHPLFSPCFISINNPPLYFNSVPCARFRTSAAISMSSWRFWDFTNNLSGPTGCFGTSVTTFQSTLPRNWKSEELSLL